MATPPRKAAKSAKTPATAAAKTTKAAKAAKGAPADPTAVDAPTAAAAATTATAVAERDEAKIAAHADDHAGHPSDLMYWKIFAFLFAVTAVEVLLYYKSLPGVHLNNAALGVLAIVKFVVVVGYFMHLKFDSRILRRLFVTGLILAVLVYCAYMLTMGVFLTNPGSGN